MRIVWQSTLSVILGFIGGLIGMNAHFHGNHSASADTIRATRFELVDSTNRTVAYWGQANEGREIQIAFCDEQGKIRAKLGISATQVVGGRPVAFSPFNELNGSDGNVRLQQRLDGSQNPVMTMGDSKSQSRLLLGHWNNDDISGNTEGNRLDKWSLVFRDSSHGWRDYVDIGVTTPLGADERMGYAVFRNSKDRQLLVKAGSK